MYEAYDAGPNTTERFRGWTPCFAPGKGVYEIMLFRITLAVFLAYPCLAQSGDRMDQIVQSYAADHQFMGTALVARGDEVLFNKAYGFANLEWNVANTPGTKFRLGSVTKQFTAASILLLEERGKLSVNDAVKKHMPDAPAAWDKVTIVHSSIPHLGRAGLHEFSGLRED